jgi:hypothetical protein
MTYLENTIFTKVFHFSKKKKDHQKMPKVFLETSETLFYDSGINIYIYMVP